MFALLSACDSAGAPEILDARIGAPAGPHAALYFTAIGGDEDDRLLGARSTVASELQIHETTTDADGTVAMEAVDGLDLPAGGTLVLSPGGYHMMLIDVERIGPGDEVDVTLVWENAGEWTMPAEVVDPSAILDE
jgi:copper(I)-binding protein